LIPGRHGVVLGGILVLHVVQHGEHFKLVDSITI
jgi:hypothetical protein